MLENTLKYFRELSKIPRCSLNEKGAINWLSSWAQENNFDYKIDNVGNLLITVPATKGKENNETVVLQGHVDMVCVKTKESNHDFKNDKIELIESNGFLSANGTTLGSDNGIGVALAMNCALLDNHPKLELLFTVDEEKGMTGVLHLEEGFITGTKLINIDTEVEGEIIIGSAGGARILIEGDFDLEKSNYIPYKFKLSGLKGGHSGLEINKSKGNIVDSLFQFLNYLDIKFELSEINSGVAENVIAKDLVANISLEKLDNLQTKINEFIKIYSEKYSENNFNIEFEKLELDINTIGYENSFKIMNSVLNSHSGVYKMSNDIEGFVLTSQNLGIIKLLDGKFRIEYLCRSSIDSDLENLVKQKHDNYRDYLKVSIKDEYLGWAEDINSDLIKVVKQNYKSVIGKEATIAGVHAGLECGMILAKMPKNSKAVSIGPNIFGAHTVNEKCEIKSIGVIAEVLERVLNEI